VKEQFIKFSPLFTGLADNELEIINAGFLPGQAAAGSKLLDNAEQSDAIYLLKQGFVRLTNENGYNLATLGPGSLVGDTSLLRNVQQDVSVIAATDIEFWKLTDRKLREIVLQTPSIGIKLSQNNGALIAQMEEYLLQRLGRIAELSTLPRNTLQAVAAVLQPTRFAPNQPLYRANETANNLYILESGLVELQGEPGQRHDGPHSLQPGAILGAVALLTRKPHVQSAIAREESLAWVLSADRFAAIGNKHPGLRRCLGRSARAHLSRSDQGQAAMRLAKLPIFAELPPQAMQSIVQRLWLQYTPAGERVYRSGDAGDALYLVESGEVELASENSQGVLEVGERIGAGGFFGEVGLLNGQVRNEDATALRNTNLWALQKSDIDLLAEQYPALAQTLNQVQALAALPAHAEDVSHFRNFDLLANLSDLELAQIGEYLHPTRFRAGEHIFRVNTPSDTLYLIENGDVRIQPLSGRGWMLGPGEEFGERSLLTNQPHNASAVAESDVELWSLAKRDFDLIMKRYPDLGVNMSRILSQRLQQANAPYSEDEDEESYVRTAMPSAGMSARRSSSQQPVSITPAPLQRRLRQPQEYETTSRRGFVTWYSGLSGWGKFNAALLILLLIFLLGIAASAAFINLLPGSSIAIGAANYSPFKALQRVYAEGSFDLVTNNKDAAQAIALLDSQAPPTSTYTPFPTDTPIPSPTPIAVDTPIPPTPTSGITLFDTPIQPEPVTVFAAPAAAEAPVAAAEVGAAAAAPAPAAARAWDGRLSQLGVTVQDANIAPGQTYWRLAEVRWADEQEAGGKHHIYVEVLDQNGARVVGAPINITWADGAYTNVTEDKSPPDYAFNYQMYATGNAYNVKVDGKPSDVLVGAGLGDLERPRFAIHTSFFLTFRESVK
jgi:CRP-like cAMP-binding protein